MNNFINKIKEITFDEFSKNTDKYLKEIEPLYTDIKNYSMKNASKWIWVDRYIHEATPLYFERNWDRRGQEVNIDDYDSKHGMHCYGLDKDGIVHAIVHPIDNEGSESEEFYIYIDNYEYAFYFDYNEPKSMINFVRKTYDGSNILSLEMFTYNGSKKETCMYKNGRIDSIIEEHFDKDGSYNKIEWTIYYDNSNELERIDRSDRTEPIYQKFDSVDMIKSHVINKLVAVIPKTLNEQGIKEPIFCVMLVPNDEADEILPPNITFVTKSELDEAIEEDVLGNDSYIWNAYNFVENMYYPEDAELIYSCSMIDQYINMHEDYELSREILFEVCKRLMKHKLEGIEVVPEFVIYPYWEDCDVEENLRKSVNTSNFKLLKKYLNPTPKREKLPLIKIKSACHEVIKSNDGRYLVSIGDRSVILWDANSRKEITKFKQIKNPSHASFSNDGKKLIVKSTIGQYGLFNLSSLELEKEFHTTENEGNNLFFSPDDNYIVDADWSGNVILIDLHEDTYDIIKKYKNYMITQINKINSQEFQFVFHAKCSRKSGFVEDNVIVLEWQYPFNENEPIERTIDYKNIDFFKYSPKNNYCSVISNSEIFIHSVNLKHLIYRMKLDYPKYLSWSMDEKYIAVVYSGNTKIIQISDFSVVKDIPMEYACFAEFTYDSEYIILGSWEKGYYIKVKDLLDNSIEL